MILLWFILLPLIGGLAAWLAGKYDQRWPRWIGLIAVVLGFLWTLQLWVVNFAGLSGAGPDRWLVTFERPWIPRLGISFLLAVDGLSLLMLVLTFFLGIIAVACSWTEITERVGAYYLTLLWTVAGIAGVFLALDLFLFYFFWELMLVPMYFLIAVWGHENRYYASFKFFIFTQGCSLLLLAAILGLYFLHGQQSGTFTFNYMELLGTALAPGAAMLLMLGFFIGFAVKLPMVPLHTWLPDAHTEAPTAGSVLLAGILLKTGAYGILRFVLPLFPEASLRFAPVAAVLGVAGILYGAVLAFSQTDLKRLVAYTSVSHLGFVLLGLFLWNEWALQGAVMEMICHALSTGALFVVVGALAERIHTRDLREMGGLWKVVPGLSGAGLFFALASLGLPGLGNFVAEFLILLGSYRFSITLTSLAAAGLVAATVYSLWLVQAAFHGELKISRALPDLSPRETAVMAVMIATLIWLGVYPRPVFETVRPAVQSILIPGGTGR